MDRMVSFTLSILRGMSWDQMRELFTFAQKRLKEERLSQVAASLTFTAVLAMVPILTIALAIFTTFPMFNTFRVSIEAYLVQSLIPKAIANTIMGYLTMFAAKATRLSAVGAAALLVTATAMMNMIDHAFNHIWRVRERRPLMQRLLVYWAIITLGPLLIGVSITVTSYLFTATSGVVENVPLLGAVFYTLVSIALTTGAFTLLYMIVPNRRVDWRDAVWGGLVAALAFELAKRLFAVFIAQFPTYTVIYGALAAMPIFLVWVYLCWLITLIGAVLVAALPVIKYERWRHVAVPGSTFVDAMAILNVLYHARVSLASAIVDTAMLRSRTHLGYDEIDSLLQTMLDVGWVGKINPEVSRRRAWSKPGIQGIERWVLLVNPDQLKVADVYRLFVFDSSGSDALARRVENMLEQGLRETLDGHFSASRSQDRVPA